VTWGHKDFGGDSTSVQAQLAVDVQHIHATTLAFAALKSNGGVVAWGSIGDGGLPTQTKLQEADSEHYSQVIRQLAVDVQYQCMRHSLDPALHCYGSAQVKRWILQKAGYKVIDVRAEDLDKVNDNMQTELVEALQLAGVKVPEFSSALSAKDLQLLKEHQLLQSRKRKHEEHQLLQSRKRKHEEGLSYVAIFGRPVNC